MDAKVAVRGPVRFRDDDDDDELNSESVDPVARANRAGLFPATYRDDPEDEEAERNNGLIHEGLDNQQIHEYHAQVISEQDEQLERLGRSIGRQRDLTIAIGDELDGQVELLGEVEEGVDRHQSQLDGATKRLNSVAKRARENWGVVTIVTLVLILVCLIVITK